MKTKNRNHSLKIAACLIALSLILAALPVAAVDTVPVREVFDLSTAQPLQGTNWYFDESITYYDNNPSGGPPNGDVNVPTLFVNDGANLTLTGTSGIEQNIRVVVSGTVNITLDNASITRTGDAIRISEGIPSPPENPATYVKVSPMMLEEGAFLTLNLVGDNTLTMARGSLNRWSAGLGVPYGAAVVIGGEGSLYAEGGLNAAGIGSHEGTHLSPKWSGDITINSGTITAVARGFAAGIGGGSLMQAGRITINGGDITAIGGDGTNQAGAGIGSGSNANESAPNNVITINGGTINATGGAAAAGIGSGANSTNNTGTININGGTINAKGGTSLLWGGAGIGGGFGDRSGNINITGGIITAIGGNQDGTSGGAAGIGGGALENSGTTSITGGIISAVGGADAQNIGNGCNGTAVGKVTIADSAYVSEVLPSSDKGLVWIEEHPQDASVTYGNINYDLTVSVGIDESISLTPAFQWYTNTTGSSSDEGSPIDGAAASKFTLPHDLAQGEHYFFAKVSFTDVQGAYINSQAAKVEVNASSDVTITAIAGNGGTVSGEGIYQFGETVNLNAVPDNGYEFDGWYKDNVKVSDSEVFTFSAQTDAAYEARFKLKAPELFKITNIDVSGEAAAGNTLTFTVQVSNGAEPIKYAYYVIGDGQVYDKLVCSEANTFSYIPEKAGDYSLRVYAIASDGKKVVSAKEFTAE